MGLMTRLLLVACLLAALVVTSAPAATRTCKTGNAYELIKATNVSCKRAKKVIRLLRISTDRTPLGFRCRTKQYPGGVTTTCRKDDKKVVHQSAD